MRPIFRVHTVEALDVLEKNVTDARDDVGLLLPLLEILKKSSVDLTNVLIVKENVVPKCLPTIGFDTGRCAKRLCEQLFQAAPIR